MRAVLDPNVLISAVIGSGAPARILEAWKDGEFELVVSELVLAELDETLARPRLARRVPQVEATAFVELLRGATVLTDDPVHPSRRSRDPDDDYLLALAETAEALLVSGDRDLLDLANELPVVSPAEFLARLEAE